MALGPFVRRLFGPYEHRIAELWRGMFVDLGDWAKRVQAIKPGATRILEVGCGEGAMTELLCEAFPHAQIDAIDISPRLGRLFRLKTDRVSFRQQFVEDCVVAQPEPYDLILLSDVLHHVPPAAQESLLASIKALLKPDGVLALKDWGRDHTPIYFAGLWSDRLLTGDDVRYKTPAEAQRQLAAVFGSERVQAQAPVRPWRNNYVFFVRGAAA